MSDNKMKWAYRPNVRKCVEREIIDCPICGGGEMCDHEDNDLDECVEDHCPRFDGKRWKKE